MATKQAAPKAATKSAPAEKKAPKEKAPRAPKTEKELAADARNPLQQRREMVGEVVSDKMQKTIVVRVDRRVRHELYGKFLVKSRRFKAHDEKNEAKVGDRVVLVETRPLSREKRWSLQSITRRAGQAPALNDVNV